MFGTKALTMAVAAVVLIGGGAAVGAAAPADQASSNATDAYAENAPSDAGPDMADQAQKNEPDQPADAQRDDEAANGDESGVSVGPSDGLPEQVPDHVSQIHETIESHLDGSIHNLGQALSDLLGQDTSPNPSAGA